MIIQTKVQRKLQNLYNIFMFLKNCVRAGMEF